MTIDDMSLFWVWVALTLLSAVLLGATITSFIYERILRKYKEIVDLLNDLLTQVTSGPPQLSTEVDDHMEQFKQVLGDKTGDLSTVESDEMGGWTPDQPTPEKLTYWPNRPTPPEDPTGQEVAEQFLAEQETQRHEWPDDAPPHAVETPDDERIPNLLERTSVGAFYRTGRSIHVEGCPRIRNSHSVTHLWALDLEQVQELANEDHLQFCGTCKPIETVRMRQRGEQNVQPVPAQGGEEGDGASEPGGSAPE